MAERNDQGNKRTLQEMTDSSADHPLLVVSPSKALRLLFSKLRDKTTSSEQFVPYAKRAMRLVVEDALAEFPTTVVTLETPCGTCQGLASSILESPADHLCAVSIVRSGDALLESVREIVPGCKVGKILIQRDESHPQKLPKLFYSKFPSTLNENMYVLLCDPMLATGGSAVTALDVMVKGKGVDPKKIILATLICAPEGLRVLAQAYPDVKIVTAVVDKELNDDKFIVPGLGDYGDRFFNTL